jgi:hypothetical protein
MRRSIVSAAVIVVLLACFWFAWPTPYRYLPSGRTRVNRFNDRVEQLTPAGWAPASTANPFDTLPSRR